MPKNGLAFMIEVGQDSSRSGSAARSPESGAVLIWSLLLVVLTTALVLSHTKLLESARRERQTRHNRDTLGATVARSGMVDALGWFRRQAQQPVRSFAPQLDLSAVPPCNDTIDPSLGLVREFQIDGSLWGRYELRHDEVVDTSNEHGVGVPGTSWSLRVRSYIYRRRDAGQGHGAAPNHVLASSSLTTEIRTMSVRLPAPAALSVDDPSKVDVREAGVIDGGTHSAIAHAPPQSAVDAMPHVDPDAVLSGAPALLPLSTFDAEATSLFGMPLATLRSYSDQVVQRAQDWEGDKPVQANSTVVFVQGDLDVEASVQLDNVLMVVHGNLTVDAPEFSSQPKMPTAAQVEALRVEVDAARSGAKTGAPGRLLDAHRDLGRAADSLRLATPDVAAARSFISASIARFDEAVAAGFDADVADDWKDRLQGADNGSHRDPSRIYGLVYVTGDAKLSDVELRGALVVRGAVTLGEKGAARVTYDKRVLDKLTKFLRRYRERRTPIPGR